MSVPGADRCELKKTAELRMTDTDSGSGQQQNGGPYDPGPLYESRMRTSGRLGATEKLALRLWWRREAAWMEDEKVLDEDWVTLPEDPRTRRYAHMAVAMTDHSGTDKAVLNMILTRMDGSLQSPNTATVKTLARDVSMEEALTGERIRALVKAKRLVWVDLPRSGLGLGVRFSEQELTPAREWLHKAWQRPRPPWSEWLLEAPIAASSLRWFRHVWERTVRDMDLSTSTKGIAMAISLTADATGDAPFQRTCDREIGEWSGYSAEWVRQVRGQLESLGMIELQTWRGRGGGWEARLRLPPEGIATAFHRYGWEADGLEDDRWQV